MNWDAAHDRLLPPEDHTQRWRQQMSVSRPFLGRLQHLGWLLAAAAASALTGMGDASAATSDASGCSSPFAAPGQPMMLTRMLRHELGAGQEVVTRRSYLIQMTAMATGFRVDGDLTGVEVTVPPNLEPIAQLERDRRDDGLFPILLDRQGAISSQSASAAPVVPPAAHKVASTIIAGAALSSGERAEALHFVDALLNARGGVLTQWPADLFRPAEARRTTTTRFPLANGETGEVSVTLEAAADGQCGLLRAFDRMVVTNIGGLQRLSHERWTLVPARH